MIVLFFILVVIACAVLGFIVLIQNPKGGGLSGTIAGFNNQFMGVKQTTDVLEKGTWIFAGIIGALCLFSTVFLKSSTSNANDNMIKNTPIPAQQQQAPPANTVPSGPTVPMPQQ